jgi:ribonuclease Z
LNRKASHNRGTHSTLEEFEEPRGNDREDTVKLGAVAQAPAENIGAPVPASTVEDLIVETRNTYAGPLESGEDLMTFEIGDTVTLVRPKSVNQ